MWSGKNTVTIHDQNGSVYTLSGLSMQMSIEMVKRNLEKHAMLKRNEMQLSYKGKELTDEATFQSIGFFPRADCLVLLRELGVGRGEGQGQVQDESGWEVPVHVGWLDDTEKPSTCEVRVVAAESGREFSLKVGCPDPSGLKVPSLKKALEEKTGIPSSQQCLTHNGVELTETCAGVTSFVYLTRRQTAATSPQITVRVRAQPASSPAPHW